jgi:hypothetical protein
MPIHWDDLYVLRVLDRLESEHRAYHGSGEELMQQVAQEMQVTGACQDPDRAVFARLLLSLARSTPPRLSFQQQTWGNARVPNRRSTNTCSLSGTSS